MGFKIGNRVRVAIPDKTYDLFDDFINSYAGIHKRKFINGYMPNRGDKGVIIAIEKHPRRGVLIAIVTTKKHVYAIGIDGLENLQPKKEILKSFDWEAFKQGKFAVHCDTEEKAREFLKECDEQGIKWWGSRQYDMDMFRYAFNYPYHIVEGYLYYDRMKYITDDKKIKIICYTPSQVREVKRPAKVGEWIKIVESDGAFGYYSDGDIFKVLENGDKWDAGAVIVGSASKMPYINSKEYVVLENYQPETTAKPLADLTDKELVDELAKRWEDKQ